MVNKELLVAAASIMTIEAKHSTLLNVINGASSVPQAFDFALNPSQVLAIAGGFISGCDLGIPGMYKRVTRSHFLKLTIFELANPSLAVSTSGAIAPGAALSFKSTGIDGLDPSVSILPYQLVT